MPTHYDISNELITYNISEKHYFTKPYSHWIFFPNKYTLPMLCQSYTTTSSAILLANIFSITDCRQKCQICSSGTAAVANLFYANRFVDVDLSLSLYVCLSDYLLSPSYKLCLWCWPTPDNIYRQSHRVSSTLARRHFKKPHGLPQQMVFVVLYSSVVMGRITLCDGICIYNLPNTLYEIMRNQT